MNKIMAAFALVIGLVVAGTSNAELVLVEGSVESSNAELLLTGENQGYVLVHDCRGDCPQKFPIDNNTRALMRGKPVSLEDARSKMRHGVTVIFDKKTRVVTRLLLM